MVIANVYADGRWSHIEHFHADHYDDRHGPADRTAIRGVVITPSKEPARAPAKWTPPKAPRPSRPLPELDVGDTDITDIGARRRRILELTASGMTGPAVAATLGIPLHMVYDARRYR